MSAESEGLEFVEGVAFMAVLLFAVALVFYIFLDQIENWVKGLNGFDLSKLLGNFNLGAWLNAWLRKLFGLGQTDDSLPLLVNNEPVAGTVTSNGKTWTGLIDYSSQLVTPPTGIDPNVAFSAWQQANPGAGPDLQATMWAWLNGYQPTPAGGS